MLEAGYMENRNAQAEEYTKDDSDGHASGGDSDSDNDDKPSLVDPLGSAYPLGLHTHAAAIAHDQWITAEWRRDRMERWRTTSSMQAKPKYKTLMLFVQWMNKQCCKAWNKMWGRVLRLSYTFTPSTDDAVDTLFTTEDEDEDEDDEADDEEIKATQVPKKSKVSLLA
jgi:hypothetical protein